METNAGKAEPVTPGQIWADNDPRAAGRTLRVDRIEGRRVVCTILTNCNTTQDEIDNPRDWRRPRDMRGKTTSISIGRFRPTSTGYRLVALEQDHAVGER